MSLSVVASDQSCGAEVRGLDLSRPLAKEQVATIREAWLQHLVLSFPDQQLTDDDLERFTLYFGPFGDDPYIAPIPGREHVIAVKRSADEATSIFAELSGDAAPGNLPRRHHYSATGRGYSLRQPGQCAGANACDTPSAPGRQAGGALRRAGLFPGWRAG